MLRRSLRGLAVAAVAALALAPGLAAAVTQLTDCADLTKAGETYIVTADITATTDVCFRVLADRITLDLGGHTVTGTGGSASIGVWDNQSLETGRISTVVKNGSIKRFANGILLFQSSRNTIRAIDASDNGVAIAVGASSLVKDCTVKRTQFSIVTREGVQVEGCYIGGTGGSDGNVGGLAGGDRMLVTRNTVIGNTSVGIRVEANSTVTHNTVRDNGEDGILVGANSLVSRNTSSDNVGNGINASCPATITHNTALGNGGLPINPPTSGNGRVVLHNITGP